MGKVFVIVVALFVLAFVLGVALRRRDRGTELFVTEAPGRQPFPGPLADEVMALLRQRRKIQAIKLLRERTGLGLADAKDAVEEFEVTGRLRLPHDPPDARPTHRHVDEGELLMEVRRLKDQHQPIQAIKLIRQRTGLGLKEAKDLYDGL